jgi:hypothetical protein
LKLQGFSAPQHWRNIAATQVAIEPVSRLKRYIRHTGTAEQ